MYRLVNTGLMDISYKNNLILHDDGDGLHVLLIHDEAMLRDLEVLLDIQIFPLTILLILPYQDGNLVQH